MQSLHLKKYKNLDVEKGYFGEKRTRGVEKIRE
jgi:hypothetical protein